jgi:hypothetical protein
MGARVDPALEAAFWSGVENAERFFMGKASVQLAMKKLATRSTPRAFRTPSPTRWR